MYKINQIKGLPPPNECMVEFVLEKQSENISKFVNCEELHNIILKKHEYILSEKHKYIFCFICLSRSLMYIITFSGDPEISPSCIS